MNQSCRDKQQRTGPRPAVLGGPPVRPEGPPDWPGSDRTVAEALQRAAHDGTWGRYHGRCTAELVERLRERLGCEHVILCASGTAAVELSLRGLRVGPGDEVLLAAYDFKGNFQNVLTVGATPVLLDVDSSNWNLDVDRIDAAVTEHTKAIVVSHLHGGVVPMRRLRDLADERGLAIVEDACQMPGGVVNGRPAGCWGDAGVFSFGGSKLLSAGRGGAVFTDRADVAQRIRLYTERGNSAYPLSELQAAVLLPQLERLDERNQRRAASAAQLAELLSHVDGLRPFRNSTDTEPCQPGYYKLGFQYNPDDFAGLSRDGFVEAMRAEGIAMDAGFRALHRIHSRRRFRQSGSLTEADRADRQTVVLHHPILLGDEAGLEQIVTAVEKVRRWGAELAASLNR